jgi:hypothetical protein
MERAELQKKADEEFQGQIRELKELERELSAAWDLLKKEPYSLLTTDEINAAGRGLINADVRIDNLKRLVNEIGTGLAYLKMSSVKVM